MVDDTYLLTRSKTLSRTIVFIILRPLDKFLGGENSELFETEKHFF